ncbi:MAG: metallophosphoesterase [Rhizobiales bacterium]|jgi:Icc-related predicted phosphoesterase|nr:metallophosphoesterase [Hyphomicrobiales bacterium]MBP9175739.1 metallophosphoesterase [Hyphomicrobiales bacterium]
MRCLVVADLHYSLPQFDWVLNVAGDFDLVIIAGDHLDLSSLVEGRAQTVVIRKYIELMREKTKVVVCSGNHDLDSRDLTGEKVAKWIVDLAQHDVPSDGASLVFEDTLFSICPWWDGPLTRDKIGEQLAADALKRTGRWFWVHHAPSDKSPTSWSGSRYLGDNSLLEWVIQYKPDMVFSGHVHQSPFVKDGSWVDRIGDTWVFNVGFQFGAPPAHIIFDTEKEEAVWLSAAGFQSIQFSQPLERPLRRLATPPAWVTLRDRAGGPSPAGIRPPAGE